MPDATTASVAVEVIYDVGAKNDPAGRSGFAVLRFSRQASSIAPVTSVAGRSAIRLPATRKRANREQSRWRRSYWAALRCA